MKKKLLAALVLSMAMITPQANADPSALEQALNDPNTERFIMPSDQSISADLPMQNERYFEINDYETATSEHYYNINGNGHSGFMNKNSGAYELNYVNTISGFNTKPSASNPNGDGGAFFLDDDACLTVSSSIFDADKNPLMTAIANNTAAGKGGAIYANYNWGGAVYLSNTNIVDNVAGDKGGGIYLDWGAAKIVSLPGTNVVIADNKAVIDGQSVYNDIYLHSGRAEQNSGGLRGTLDLMTRSTANDPSSSVPTGAGRIYVGDIRVEGSSDIDIMSSTKDTAIGQVMIENLMLDNDAMLSTRYVAPNSKTSIYIPELTMSRDSIINTVNGYIDDNLHIVNISLDNSNNKFMVDASLMNGNTVIDSFGTITGGTGKLAVNIIGSDTTSGMVRMSSAMGNATFADSTTQYGGLKYTFTQDEDDKGIFHYTTTKDRSVTLQEALKDWTLTEYDMPDLTVADSDLGYMWHYDDEGYFVERTLTINGNGGILITDGQERSGIQIPTQLYPPEEDFLTPKLIVNDLELVSGFTTKASDLDSFGTGGAIDAEDSVLELHNVTFSDNVAKGAGTTVDINTFGMGGAVYLITKDGYERVIDPDTGGYIEGDHFKSIIEDSTFLNNKAISTQGSSGGFAGIVDGGGAVFSKGDLDITNSLFASNSAISAINEGTAEAGALYLTNNSEYAGLNCNVNIADTMFMSNIAGDVENEGDALLNTSAYGGALMASRVDLNISNSQFVDNLAQAAQLTNEYTTIKGEAQGGAIHIDRMLPGSNAINIDNTTFAMNETKVVDSATLSSDGVSQSKSMGGAIAIMPQNAINKMTVNITNSDFVANKSGTGGAIYNAGSDLIIKDSTFNSNTANHYYVDSSPRWNEDMRGGAIYNASFAKLSLDGVTFTGNYAKEITYDGETPIVSTVKNDITNDAASTGGLYFIGDASTLDGGIVGNGYTHFNLGLDEFGNVDPEATNTEMTIGANTRIIQSVIEVNSGTVNFVNADNITARSSLVIGDNGTLNIADGNVNFTGKYVREIENNGTLTKATGYLTDPNPDPASAGLTINNNGIIKASINNTGTVNNAVGASIDTSDSDVNAIINNADATIINAGTMTSAQATNSGNFINGVNPSDPEEIVADATITTTDSDNGFVNEADATLLNYGVVEGTVDNEGTFTNNGIVNGNTSNDNGGIVTNNGTMNGYADNFGETSVFVNNNIIDNSQAEEEQYVINEGSYTNNGTIIGGVENEDGTFYNNGTIDSTNTDSDYIVNDEGQFINNGTVTSAVVYSDGQLVNGANPTDPTETNPNATINANIINDGTVYNAGTIVGDVSNETPMSSVYLYEGGTIKGNVGDEENSNGILGLIGGNGTIDGDVNVQTLGMAQMTDTPVGELHITGDVNSQSFFSSGGALNLQNGEAGVASLGDIILAGNTKLLVDVDLKNNKVDALNGTINEAYSNPDAKFEISNMNIASDSKKVGKTTLDMFNGDEESRAALKGRLTASKGLKVNSPIFNYAGKYDAENGTLALNKSFNPSVMAGPVAAQMGGYLAQLSAYSEAFGNMDSYMLMSSEQRLALKHKNHYAASDANLVYDPTMLRQERADAWFRPYASFESVNLKNGPKVSNTMYGTFAGGDSRMISLGHGWDAVFGGYVGYNGSHQTFDGISVYQNGGTLGGTGMFYKGNFFTGLTANVGANAGEASTMFGRENFTMLMTGVASKTGYNFELADRKFIIQPSMLMSYSFVNTFDYTNAAGVKIESDPLNALQLQPELKFIGNLKNGWQPYASVAMVWNVMDKAKFSANDVALPEMSVKPFVKYGVGVKKTWGERFSGFFQTYLTNGGRNGVGLQAGFTWALGKAPEKTSDMKLHKAPEMKKTKISLNNSNVH